MKKYLLLFLISFQWLSGLHAQTLTGTVTDLLGAPVPNARVTIFLNDTSLFREARTDANGVYLFENLEPFFFFFNVAARGFELFQNATTGIVGTIVHDAQLETETQPGQWTTIMDSPEPLGGTDLGVLLPDGRVYYCHNTKDPFVFDPVANDTMFIPGDNLVQGCAATKMLWNGNVIMAGGTDMEIYGPGSQKIKQFNLATKTWQPMPNLLDYRWYPAMTQLANGKLLIVGGGGLNNPVRVKTSELYDPIAGTTEWADMVSIGMEQSPLFTLYSGKALMTFRPPQLFDPVTKQWDLAADFVQGNRMPNGDHVDHELVHLPEGDVIAIGFKPFPAGSGGTLVERYNPIANTWALRSSFAPLRSRPKTVFTPDRRILVMAGEKEQPNDPTPVNQWNYMDLNDQYDPYSDTWRRLTPMPRKREYHALAILVPDGRVIVVGGEGQPGNEPPKSIIDAYEPPYLFRGVRPQILNLAKTDYYRGEEIQFDVARTNAPTAVVLQSTQAVTHMVNSGENRFLDLNFSVNNQAIVAQIPNDSLMTMPGWYMLWVMVDDIPSVARMVRILPGQAPAIVIPPTAAFTATPTNGCTPLSVQFVNASSANATDFAWTFPGGNPTSSTAQNPTVVYNTPGTYSVTLVASNVGGSNTVTQTNSIAVNATPSVGFSNSANGAVVTFTNSSSNANTYAWDFGDNSGSTEANPTHTYTNDGPYTVALIATNACGSVTTTQTVTIATPPSASFNTGQTNGCVPFTVQFNNTSSSNAVTFDWQFPGGTPANSTDQNPLVIYNTPGVYSIILTASNTAGSSTATQMGYITVDVGPSASFTSVVSVMTAAFSNTSSNGTSYTWDFGDGGGSTEANPSYTYANDGTYVVVLTVTNACGTSTVQQILTINTVGTNEAEWTSSFRLYPNPAAESIVWELSNPEFLPETIHLLDPQGRICRTWAGDQIPKTLSTSGLPTGVYFLKLKTAQRVFSRKVVLKY